MPISKRINNLKIRSSSNEQCCQADHSEASSFGSVATSGQGPDPVSNAADNSHYLHINRLLYEAHLARQQRMTQQS